MLSLGSLISFTFSPNVVFNDSSVVLKLSPLTKMVRTSASLYFSALSCALVILSITKGDITINNVFEMSQFKCFNCFMFFRRFLTLEFQVHFFTMWYIIWSLLFRAIHTIIYQKHFKESDLFVYFPASMQWRQVITYDKETSVTIWLIISWSSHGVRVHLNFMCNK